MYQHIYCVIFDNMVRLYHIETGLYLPGKTDMGERLFKTAVMTDTNSGMSVREGTERGIHVLALPVIIDGAVYYEGVNVTHEDVYRAMDEGLSVSTSQPAVGELNAAWNRILNAGYDEIVYIPMSSGLSSSCANAALDAQSFGGRVTVIDNHRISVTLYTAVLEAKLLADAGKTGREIREQLESHANMASIYITVDSVEHLKKSGRITEAGAMLATVMKIKPILLIDGGKLDAYSKVRGMVSARKRMLAAIIKDRNERFKDVPDKNMMVALSGTMRNQEIVQTAIDTLHNEFPDNPFIYRPLSCSIACHTGPDAIGFGLIEVPENLKVD